MQKRVMLALVPIVILLVACRSPQPTASGETPTASAFATFSPTTTPTPTCQDCITISSITAYPGQFTLAGESALPDGTCLRTQLFVEDEPLSWWPADTRVTVQGGTWQVSVSLEESGAPYKRPPEGGYRLVAWQEDRRIASAVFWVEYSGPPTPSRTRPTVAPTVAETPAPTPTRKPTPTPIPPSPEPSLPFTHTLQTYQGREFSFQYPANAEVENVPPRRMAWQAISPATAEIHVTGPEIWIKPGDAEWSHRGPAYELTVRTYENPEGLDAEAWARNYILASWQEAKERDRPWGSLPVSEEGEIDEDKVGSATIAEQPAFWVSYFAFDSSIRAYYLVSDQGIVELSFRLYPLANQPLAMVQRDVYALILNTFRLESEATLPPGLTIETYALDGPPQVEPLTFVPVQGTQEEVLAKRQRERDKTFPHNSVIVDGQRGLSAQLGSEKLVASNLYTDVVTSQGGFQQVTVQVSRNGEPIYAIPAGDGGPIDSLRGLWAYSDHWVLEFAVVTQTISSENTVWFDSLGQIARDGELLNEREGYQEAFGFQLMNGKPFYFFKRDGQIGISYDDQEMVLGYSSVPHYACCSAAERNPRSARNMVAFFAQRDERWYYVEIGAYEGTGLALAPVAPPAPATVAEILSQGTALPFEVCGESTMWERPPESEQDKWWRSGRYDGADDPVIQYPWTHAFFVTYGHGSTTDDVENLSGLWTLPGEVWARCREPERQDAILKLQTAEVWSLYHRVTGVRQLGAHTVVVVEPVERGVQFVQFPRPEQQVPLTFHFVTEDGQEIEEIVETESIYWPYPGLVPTAQP